jgi:ubiquinone biosynthesis protein COQ9
MRSPFAERERERLIAAILPDVPFDGWTQLALRHAARRADIPVGAAITLFPRGAPDLIAAFSQWADTQMVQRLTERLRHEPAEPASLSRRVALALRLRFEVLLPWREAVRRGLAVLALPHNAPLALRLLYDAVDAIWRAVGDQATDFSFYTKRATLAGIYAAATLYWLDDRSPEFTDTLAFIDRRLADLHRLGELRERFAAAADRLPNPRRLLLGPSRH